MHSEEWADLEPAYRRRFLRTVAGSALVAGGALAVAVEVAVFPGPPTFCTFATKFLAPMGEKTLELIMPFNSLWAVTALAMVGVSLGSGGRQRVRRQSLLAPGIRITSRALLVLACSSAVLAVLALPSLLAFTPGRLVENSANLIATVVLTFISVEFAQFGWDEAERRRAYVARELERSAWKLRLLTDRASPLSLDLSQKPAKVRVKSYVGRWALLLGATAVWLILLVATANKGDDSEYEYAQAVLMMCAWMVLIAATTALCGSLLLEANTKIRRKMAQAILAGGLIVNALGAGLAIAVVVAREHNLLFIVIGTAGMIAIPILLCLLLRAPAIAGQIAATERFRFRLESPEVPVEPESFWNRNRHWRLAELEALHDDHGKA